MENERVQTAEWKPGACARWICLCGLLLVMVTAQVRADEVCLKRVFNQYCLGGDIDAVLRREPSPEFQQRRGERLALVYPDGRESIYVLSFKGRIYKVLRRYKPSTLLRYNELMQLLSGKYGEPENRSQFPEFASGQSSRIGAIRRGEGRAVYIWRPTQGQWHVVLDWNRELGLTLAYVADRLDAAQKQSEDSGF